MVNASMDSSDPKGLMTIGTLAARFRLGTHVLRHWESIGVLTPAAHVNGRRRYSYDQVARVAVILRAKAGGPAYPSPLRAGTPAD